MSGFVRKKDNANKNTNTSVKGSVNLVSSREYGDEDQFLNLLRYVCDQYETESFCLLHILYAESPEDAYELMDEQDLMVIADLLPKYNGRRYSKNDVIILFLNTLIRVYTGKSKTDEENVTTDNYDVIVRKGNDCIRLFISEIGDADFVNFINSIQPECNNFIYIFYILLLYDGGKLIAKLNNNITNKIFSALFVNPIGFSQFEIIEFTDVLFRNMTSDQVEGMLLTNINNIDFYVFVFYLIMTSYKRFAFLEFIEKISAKKEHTEFLLDFLLRVATDESLKGSPVLKYFYNQLGFAVLSDIMNLYAIDLEKLQTFEHDLMQVDRYSRTFLYDHIKKSNERRTAVVLFRYKRYVTITESIWENASEYVKDALFWRLMKPATDKIIASSDNPCDLIGHFFNDEYFNKEFDNCYKRHFKSDVVSDNLRSDTWKRLKYVKKHYADENEENRHKAIETGIKSSMQILSPETYISLIMPKGDNCVYEFLRGLFIGAIESLRDWLTGNIVSIYETLVGVAGFIKNSLSSFINFVKELWEILKEDVKYDFLKLCDPKRTIAYLIYKVTDGKIIDDDYEQFVKDYSAFNEKKDKFVARIINTIVNAFAIGKLIGNLMLANPVTFLKNLLKGGTKLFKLLKSRTSINKDYGDIISIHDIKTKELAKLYTGKELDEKLLELNKETRTLLSERKETLGESAKFKRDVTIKEINSKKNFNLQQNKFKTDSIIKKHNDRMNDINSYADENFVNIKKMQNYNDYYLRMSEAHVLRAFDKQSKELLKIRKDYNNRLKEIDNLSDTKERMNLVAKTDKKKNRDIKKVDSDFIKQQKKIDRDKVKINKKYDKETRKIDKEYDKLINGKLDSNKVHSKSKDQFMFKLAQKDFFFNDKKEFLERMKKICFEYRGKELYIQKKALIEEFQQKMVKKREALKDSIWKDYDDAIKNIKYESTRKFDMQVAAYKCSQNILYLYASYDEFEKILKLPQQIKFSTFDVNTAYISYALTVSKTKEEKKE